MILAIVVWYGLSSGHIECSAPMTQAAANAYVGKLAETGVRSRIVRSDDAQYQLSLKACGQ